MMGRTGTSHKRQFSHWGEQVLLLVLFWEEVNETFFT
jgi:hypothetical protein